LNHKIDKPWVAFGIFKSSMGKIVEDNSSVNSNVHILYIEGQIYPPEIWDIRYVIRFDTPKELAGYISGYTDDYTYDGAMQYLRDHFPSDFKKG
jgi:hypothetical protein